MAETDRFHRLGDAASMEITYGDLHVVMLGAMFGIIEIVGVSLAAHGFVRAFAGS